MNATDLAFLNHRFHSFAYFKCFMAENAKFLEGTQNIWNIFFSNFPHHYVPKRAPYNSKNRTLLIIQGKGFPFHGSFNTSVAVHFI